METTSPERKQAFNILKKIAAKTDSLRLATLASTVYTSGHFDAVIADIGKMIVALRAEEKADIEHRDWCEAQTAAAHSANENLEYDQEQLAQKKERAENKKTELEAEVERTEQEMADLEAAMEDAKLNRIAENEAFKIGRAHV